MMKADQVDVSWDEDKNKWLIRITVGEEVIRRYTDDGRSTDPTKLRLLAEQTAEDEGYEVNAADIFLE
jgi:hypothetical protein